MKENLTGIAKRLGLSAATVSRVLSGKAGSHRISPETQKRVMEEALRCQYTPPHKGKSADNSLQRTIALVLPTVANPYFAELAGAVVSELNAKGFTTLLIDCQEDPQLQKSFLGSISRTHIDGILAAPCGEDASFFEYINENYMPVVLVDRYFEGAPLSFVTSNNFKGAKEGTELLLARGHRHIACICGNGDSMPNRRRAEGYREALLEAGCEENALILGDAFSSENGYLCTQKLFSEENDAGTPTAIFAMSYTILLGVLKALRELGLRCPEDVSLLTFDENLCLDYMVPRISRVEQAIRQMGISSARLLIDRINGGDDFNNRIELNTTLVERESIRDIR